MAVGEIACGGNAKKAVCLMTAQTANTSAPTDADEATVKVATGVVPVYPTSKIAADDGHCYMATPASKSTLVISSSAGSGTMVGTFTLWCYLTATGKWYPKTVNGGAALAETAADAIRHVQSYDDLGHFDYLYLELAAVGGTDTAFEAYLITSRTVSY